MHVDVLWSGKMWRKNNFEEKKKIFLSENSRKTQFSFQHCFFDFRRFSSFSLFHFVWRTDGKFRKEKPTEKWNHSQIGKNEVITLIFSSNRNEIGFINRCTRKRCALFESSIFVVGFAWLVYLFHRRLAVGCLCVRCDISRMTCCVVMLLLRLLSRWKRNAHKLGVTLNKYRFSVPSLFFPINTLYSTIKAIAISTVAWHSIIIFVARQLDVANVAVSFAMRLSYFWAAAVATTTTTRTTTKRKKKKSDNDNATMLLRCASQPKRVVRALADKHFPPDFSFDAPTNVLRNNSSLRYEYRQNHDECQSLLTQFWIKWSTRSHRKSASVVIQCDVCARPLKTCAFWLDFFLERIFDGSWLSCRSNAVRHTTKSADSAQFPIEFHKRHFIHIFIIRMISPLSSLSSSPLLTSWTSFATTKLKSWLLFRAANRRANNETNPFAVVGAKRFHSDGRNNAAQRKLTNGADQ